ncbi:MAG: hypothetical protein AAF182_04510 [Pseudomonadota bacterium]
MSKKTTKKKAPAKKTAVKKKTAGKKTTAKKTAAKKPAVKKAAAKKTKAVAKPKPKNVSVVAKTAQGIVDLKKWLLGLGTLGVAIIAFVLVNVFEVEIQEAVGGQYTTEIILAVVVLAIVALARVITKK